MINDLNTRLNIPHTVKEWGVPEEDFKKKVEFMAHNAVLDACTGSNPRPIDEETMKKIYNCAFYGDKVNF